MIRTFNAGSGSSPGNQTPLALDLPLAQNQNLLLLSAMRAGSETKPELGHLEAELRRMKEENDCLMQEIRMQQLGGKRNDMYPMMSQQHHGGETIGENKIGGHFGGLQLQTASASVDIAGNMGFPAAASTTATATDGAVMGIGGMTRMSSSMNTMMPNPIMADRKSDMNSNSSMTYTSSLSDAFASMAGISSGSCSSKATVSSDITQPISNLSNADEKSYAEDEEELQASEEPNWERRYRELIQYKFEHGHTRVPARWKRNPQLGRWVMTQRRQVSASKCVLVNVFILFDICTSYTLYIICTVHSIDTGPLKSLDS